MTKAVPYPYDTTFVAKCREMQSKYREEILNLPLRPYVVQNSRSKDFGKTFHLGNYISEGEESGANFLEKYIFEHAKERIRDRKPYETFDEDRMFNNLLSSQPMAFNLFCPLRKLLEENQEAATEAIRKALPHYSIAMVTAVELEFIPYNYQNLTGDKSAMDAIIKYKKHGLPIAPPCKLFGAQIDGDTKSPALHGKLITFYRSAEGLPDLTFLILSQPLREVFALIHLNLIRKIPHHHIDAVIALARAGIVGIGAVDALEQPGADLLKFLPGSGQGIFVDQILKIKFHGIASW